jgi:hypothetical protein
MLRSGLPCDGRLAAAAFPAGTHLARTFEEDE